MKILVRKEKCKEMCKYNLIECKEGKSRGERNNSFAFRNKTRSFVRSLAAV